MPNPRRVLPLGLGDLCLWCALLGARGGLVFAQSTPWADEHLPLRRSVNLPDNLPPPPIVVVDFFSHGGVRDAGDNVAVYAREQRVAWRVLQVGPGDYCRVAFQPARDRRQYHVYYGGDQPSGAKSPEWAAAPGLLLETRQWKAFDLNRFEALQAAFVAARPIGSDYVPQVYHRENPFAPNPGPFLSRYAGTIRVPLKGKATLFTSSQDCSFLLIDGKQVVAAPGAHPPQHQARIKGEVELTEGDHRFEYWHAASGAEACMVAAWQLPGFDKPTLIGADAFQSDQVKRFPTARLEKKPGTPLPDFRLQLAGETPLENSDQPLVRVRFADVSPPIVTEGAKHRWDFGDGQSSSQKDPEHIYLHPGEFRVTLSVRRGDHLVVASSRIQVVQPPVVAGAKDQPDSLAAYLPKVRDYEPSKLDAESLVQLVRALLAANDLPRAAAAGNAAFTAGTAGHTDESRWALVTLLGPALRDQLNDPSAALQIWREAGKQIRRSEWRTQCALEAADILIRDLLHTDEAKPLVDYAVGKLATETGELASRAQRVYGDWLARRGDAAGARAAYGKAATKRPAQRNSIEASAWRGARSRSVEAFLRENEPDRARDELRRWEDEFPLDRMEGYLSLLWARYLVAADRPLNAIAAANDLLAVNPASPYADRLLLVAAQCEEKLQHTDRAVAAWRSLISDYPGSPLVEKAKEELARLSKP